MAVTFDGDQLPEIKTFQTSATPDQVTEVQIPIGARNVLVVFDGAEGVVSTDQALVDASSTIVTQGATSLTLASGVGFNFDFSEGEHGGATEIRYLYVTSNTASTFCTVVVSG